MGRLKNREMYSTSIDKELLAQLKKLSESTRIPQSRLMDEAIEDLLKKHGFTAQK
jgi:predicted transcriptional regulator